MESGQDAPEVIIIVLVFSESSKNESNSTIFFSWILKDEIEFLECILSADWRFRRDLPIQADYIGATVDTLISERVSVEWKEIEGEDKIVLYTPENNG